jgi:probable phosphoglycerate mutase
VKTQLLMVRHATCAHTEDILLGRALDEPLDARGRAQAHLVSEYLRDEQPLRVTSSPRRRTLETARAIATRAHCELVVTGALDELDFGHWAGQRFVDLEHDPAWRRWNHDRENARTPAGATIAGVQRRVDSYLIALATRFSGTTLILVTHAEVIRAIVLKVRGLPASDYAQIAIAPASVTCLSVERGSLRIEDVRSPMSCEETP